MRIDVFTLFPDWFDWFLEQRHVRNALAARPRRAPRSTTATRRRSAPARSTTRPYGGGAGMVIRVDVVDAALQARLRRRHRRDARRAGGSRARRLRAAASTTRVADELAGLDALTLLCGRYEGFDERVTEHLANDVVSIGPYVLSGGELAAMVVADAVLRKLPGALGHEDSALEESFSQALEGAPGVPALHPARVRIAAGRCRTCCCRGTTRGCASGGSSRAAARRGDPRLTRRASSLTSRRSATVLAPRRPLGHGGPSPMNELIQSVERRQLRHASREFQAGDRVRVHFQVVEGTRRRTQVFEGVVLKRQGTGARETFTVRKLSFGVGVERTFPAPLAEDRADRGRGPRRRPPREALLPARARRPPRARARAPGLPARGRRHDGRPERRRRRHGGRSLRAGRRDAGQATRADEADPPTRGGRGAAEAEARRARRPKPGRGSRAEACRRSRARGAAAEAHEATTAAAEGSEDAEPERAGGGQARGPARLTAGERKLVGRSSHGSLLELVVIVAVALGLALLIQAFLVKPYRIPSESMEPTLDVGQRVLVSRFNYHFSDPDRGDIVVFQPPKGADSNDLRRAQQPEDQACPRADADEVRQPNFIKRDRRRSPATRSQDPAGPRGRERQAAEGAASSDPCRARHDCNFPRPIKIPPGHFFMMGDNRGESDDSRFWGPVPKKWIIGQAFFTYWPPERASAPSNITPRSAGGRERAARRRCSRSTARSSRRFVAGADEAGRGSLAGPLVAAAVLFDLERLTLSRAALAHRGSTTRSSTTEAGARSSTRS